MSWSDAQSRLLEQLRTIDGAEVHITPPLSFDDNAVHISMPPPASDTERRAGIVRRDTYEQEISIQRRIPGESRTDNDAIALMIDSYRETVNAILDDNVALGGHAVSVTPPSWDALTVIEYPPGSGRLVAQMVCTITIEIETLTRFTY